jgi:hypothetical protein
MSRGLIQFLTNMILSLKRLSRKDKILSTKEEVGKFKRGRSRV